MYRNVHFTNNAANDSRGASPYIYGLNVDKYGEFQMSKSKVNFVLALVRHNGDWDALSDETGLTVKECRQKYSTTKSKLKEIVENADRKYNSDDRFRAETFLGKMPHYEPARKGRTSSGSPSILSDFEDAFSLDEVDA